MPAVNVPFGGLFFQIFSKSFSEGEVSGSTYQELMHLNLKGGGSSVGKVLVYCAEGCEFKPQHHQRADH